MNTLKPWREVAEPRQAIADGTFDEAQFAADLGTVDRNKGADEYRDPVAFCQQTYLTGNLRAVLSQLATRLSGDPSAPGVYRMQTEFGGGKTHTMLAAYHLFRDPARVAATPLARELASGLGRTDLPKATVAVLDGAAIHPGEPERTPEGLELYTLLGQLAYRLSRAPGYALVASQDRDLLGTSTQQLAELLRASAPCLVLLDETLEYLGKALAVGTGETNLAAITLTFIKELCTAVSSVPGAALVITLTGSHLEDYSATGGREELYERLSKVVGREERIVTPVEGDDVFPILHRRLFQTVGPESVRRQVAEAYARYYQQLGDAVPTSYRDASYQDRMVSAYPFHPELVDLLTNRWASLTKFQRTRGALRLLSHTVKALWQQGHRAPLIHVGDMPLDDTGVCDQVLSVAGEGYKPALNTDIIRPDSRAPQEDRRRGGIAEELGLGTAIATAAFLHSHGADRFLGASTAQLLVGVGRPGLHRGWIDDVRDSLESLLFYMRLEAGRYRFTTEPNLNKVIVEREDSIDEHAILGLLYQAVEEGARGDPLLKVVTRVTESTAVPDEGRLSLGVLDFAHTIGQESTDATMALVDEILNHHGSTFRANRNALLLAAADTVWWGRARASARNLAALRAIKGDRQVVHLSADQQLQLDKRLTAAEERLPDQVVMAYRHLLMLGQGDNGGPAIEHVDLGPAAPGARIANRVLEHLRSSDRIIEGRLAPAALLSARFGLLREGNDAIELDTLLAHFWQLPRLPKLGSRDVLRDALVDGVRAGLFGLASGSSWDAEDAVLRFRETVDPGEVDFQPGTYLVRRSAMEILLARSTSRDGREPVTEGEQAGPSEEEVRQPAVTPSDGERRPQREASHYAEVTLTITGVPGERMRDVLKVAIIPLSANSAEVAVDLTIRAQGGVGGIPRDTLRLTVEEGLRQLSLAHDLHTQDLP